MGKIPMVKTLIWYQQSERNSIRVRLKNLSWKVVVTAKQTDTPPCYQPPETIFLEQDAFHACRDSLKKDRQLTSESITTTMTCNLPPYDYHISSFK
uniref:Ovule protein n=1 Tax=Heterorhabditis bacteriophora TaxID=37862 RepID=A0A1I7X3C9_HETBA